MERPTALTSQLRELLAAEGIAWSEHLAPHVDALLDAAHRAQDRTTLGDETMVGPETWYADSPTEQVSLDEQTQDVDRLAGRYELLGLLGKGGMGTVYRARDRELNRIVALKQLHPNTGPIGRSRFLQEAQATSQLEHPGIVPVYDVGLTDEDSPYYTMQIIRGRTLFAVLTELHGASQTGHWGVGYSGVTFHRIIQTCWKMCEAMAFAHDRGVTHRDLKPQNIMVGVYGQTMVVDWGLAKIRGQDEEGEHDDTLVTTRTSSSDHHTMLGLVAGTPHYMPPEQARGEITEIGPWSDVWSLGAILYEVLTGHPLFDGAGRNEVLAKVITAEIPDPRTETDLPLPDDLVEVVLWCLRADPKSRPQSAAPVARAIGAWLAGEHKREQALRLAEQANELQQEVEALRQQADEDDTRSEEMLGALAPWRPVPEKQPAWALQQRAAEQRARADHLEGDRLHRLRQAHQLAPDLPEVNRPLAEYLLTRHREAEARGDLRAARELIRQLEHHADPSLQPYLDGVAWLTLDCSTPSEVFAQRILPQGHRMVAQERILLGITPLRGIRLEKGSYLLTLRAKGHAEVRYPVLLGRDETWWTGPEQDQPQHVWLPDEQALGPDECFIPAGWFIEGGDPQAHVVRPARKLWLDHFVMQRLPVTVGEFCTYLEALHAAGEEQTLEASLPPRDTMPVEIDTSGRVTPLPDAEGFLWQSDFPMHSVDLQTARRYAAWRSEQDGLPWRLPTSQEWEKAARGVDGRYFPFGNHLDATWARMVRSSPNPSPVPCGSYPTDCSVYGVHDLGGGQSCWTESLFDPRQSQMIIRGGSWGFGSRAARSADMMRSSPETRRVELGIRLVRTLSPSE